MQNIKPHSEIVEFPITFENEDQSPIQNSDFIVNQVDMTNDHDEVSFDSI